MPVTGFLNSLKIKTMSTRGWLMSNFEEFYSAFPNKQAKERCRKYYAAIGDDEHKEIMLALDAHKRWRRDAKKAGQFVSEWCNAATWIYQKRYRDELPTSHAELREKAKQQNHNCACGKRATQKGKAGLICVDCWYKEHADEERVLYYTSRLRAECRELGIRKDPTYRAFCVPLIKTFKQIGG